MSTPATIEFRLFGTPSLSYPGGVVDSFPTRRALCLLCRLAIEPELRLGRRELAEILWPGEPYTATGPRLRQELVRLRRALGEIASIVGSDSDSVWLEAQRITIDARTFESTCREFRNQKGIEVLATMRQAAATSRRQFLEGMLEVWIEAERNRLNGLRYTLLVNMGTILVSAAEYEEAHQVALQAIALAPHREAAHLLAMTALHHAGQVQEALAHFQDLKRISQKGSLGRVSSKAQELADKIAGSSDAAQFASLPFGATTFGRQDETDRLGEWLNPRNGPARLVTILGPGGIGKTHLLIHACHRLAAEFEGQIAFVDLSEETQPALVPLAILRALGQEYVAPADPMDRLVSVLPNNPLLLALDNVEQLAEAMPPLLLRLLAERPNLRIVCSSRIALNLAGEYKLPISPLQVPSVDASQEELRRSPSVCLFLQSMESAGVATDLEAESDELVRIVRFLEGVPLGITLAASRVRTLGVSGLWQSLAGDGGELQAQAAGIPERHRSLRKALEGSFNVLPDELRLALSHLSVFRGGWTCESARDVCELTAPEDTMRLLLDASLIERLPGIGTPRFRMLDTVRTHAQSLLSPERRDRNRRRHLAWLLRLSEPLARSLVDESSIVQYRELEPERENIQEAFAFAIESDPDSAFRLAARLASYFLHRTDGYEARLIFGELFERHGERPPDLLVFDALLGYCLLAHFFQYPNAADIYGRAMAAADALGLESYRVLIWTYEAFRVGISMRYDALEEITGLIRAHPSSRETQSYTGLTLRHAGSVDLYNGKPSRARDYFRKAVQFYRENPDLFMLLISRQFLALAAIECGDLDMAEAVLAGLLEDTLRIQFHRIASMIHHTLGRLYDAKGQLDQAVQSYERAREIWLELGRDFHVADEDWSIGCVRLKEGRLEEAGSQFAAAAKRWYAGEYHGGTPLALGGVGLCLLRMNEQGKGALIIGPALQSIEERRIRYLESQNAFVEMVRGELASLGEDSSAGECSLEEAVRLAESLFGGGEMAPRLADSA